jgi:hypothetical protein
MMALAAAAAPTGKQAQLPLGVRGFTCSLLRTAASSHPAMCKHWHSPQSACMLFLSAGMGRHLTALHGMCRHTSGTRTHRTAAV